MATAEELLAQMEKNPELYADSTGPVNDVIVINAEERTIELPESEKIFGVESDKASERKYFKCPKIVGDNIDLSTLNLFINFKNANNEGDIYAIDDVEVEGDYITFSWKLSRKVTAYKTDSSKNQLLSFIFCAKNGEGPDNEWNTTICSDGVVLEGLEPGESIAEDNPDIIQHILERLDSAGTITPEQISGAVEEYFASNPIEETDPTIPSWAKEETPDKTLSKEGKAADAKEVGDRLGQLSDENTAIKTRVTNLEQNGTGTGTGLSTEIKSALMTVVENIGLWKDGNGQIYIDNLRTALYNAPLSSIAVVYTQSKTVYPTDELETLKDDLVVTGYYTDGSSATVTDYTLSGSLFAGTSTITVAKDGKTATFEVTVAEARVPATGITLDNTTLSFTGSTPIQLTATVEPLNSTDTVVWSSSEEAVAKVENGLVTPVSDGSCAIYATAGDYTAECSVSVALPISGVNIGNPYLMYDETNPNTSGLTEEELQGKWYNAAFTTWGNALGYDTGTMARVFLHPFTDGTYYIRLLTKSTSPDDGFFAFSNGDIGVNPTTKLGKVGSTYTDATVTKFSTFDCEYTDSLGRVDLGAWTQVDGSETEQTQSFVYVYKLTVPKDVYVFLASSSNTANNRPGISEAHPYMNDLYTIFENDPSANILQVVE